MKARAREDTHFPSLRNRNNDGAPKEYTESITGHGGGRRRGYEQRNDDNHSVAQSTATQKSEYLQTLEQQIKEKEDRKRKEKEEQARYEKKMEEEAQKFDYFGSGKRGGGGDPVRGMLIARILLECVRTLSCPFRCRREWRKHNLFEADEQGFGHALSIKQVCAIGQHIPIRVQTANRNSPRKSNER